MTACAPVPPLPQQPWMPRDLRCGRDHRARHAFERLGFRFGPPVPGTPFRAAELPAGWRRAAADTPGRSWLLDAAGRPRVAIQVMGRGRAEEALAALVRRYVVEPADRGGSPALVAVSGAARFGAGVLVPCRRYRLPVRLFGSCPPLAPDAPMPQRQALWREQEFWAEAARRWLGRHAPRWQDPLEHWDEELPAAVDEPVQEDADA